MLEEEFSIGDSIFHKGDPRIKIILALELILAIVLNNDVISALLVFCFTLLCVLIARLRLIKVIKRLLVINTFIAFLWLFLPFSTPGRTLFHIFGFKATLEGIIQSLLITLKANSAFLVIICFVATTPIPLLGHGLYKLKVPSKFILLFLLTYRYINVIFEEFTRLMNAAKIRNFYPKTNIHTYKTIAYILAMVLIKSYERGKRVYNAMVLRGFNGKFYSLTETRISANDLIIVGIAFSIVFLANIDVKGYTLWISYLN